MELPGNYNRSAKHIQTESVSVCPVCGKNEFKEITSGYDFELETCINEWFFYECESCKCWIVNPRPDKSELSVIYPETYYSYNLSKTISPVALKGKELLDHIKFNSILSTIRKEPKSYLDIGCGDGRYLKYFAKRGIDKKNIYGLELSQLTVDALNSEGYKAFNETIDNCRSIPEGSIDLITMFHVIEHMHNPREVLSIINGLLSPSGILVIETPNTDSLDAKLFKKYWWGGYHIPRHWVLFERNSLKQLFTNTNHEIVDIKYQTGHSFWMYSFHHFLKYNKYCKFEKIANWFDPMKGLPFLIFFTGMDFIRKLLKFKTSSIMVIGKKRPPI